MAHEHVHKLELVVNDKEYSRRIPDDTTLLDLLREELGLTGTKCGCGYGACGACTVLLEGKPKRSCTTLARDVAGKRIETIEGLAKNGELDPVQEAFLRHGAYQCGYCTPGMIVRIRGFLNSLSGRIPKREDVASALRRHICRCGSYQRILDAALDAAAELGKEGGE